MGWLIGLVAVLAVVAVVGHGIWVGVAAILRELFNPASHLKPRRLAASGDEKCPACGTVSQSGRFTCELCGLDFDSRLGRQLARVRAAEAEVKGLGDTGQLDQETARAVLAELRKRARRVQGLPAEPRTAHPPETAAPPPEPTPAFEPAPEPTRAPEPAAVEAAVAAVEAVAVPAEPVQPVAAPTRRAEPPKRGSVLSAFMEQRNILWGELVGGLLIVGCSIALVVTLWQRLEAFPYFPFALSAAVTLALYGAGQYTLHHWKLTATSVGLLAIALLLAPLDLLLLSEPITRGETSLPLELGTKIGAVLLFAWVVRGGGRDVLTAHPGWRWWLALGVVGAPATQLLADAPFGVWSEVLPAWLALGCFAGACGATLRTVRKGDAADHGTGAALLQFVGLAAFALAASWGLQVARSPDAAGRLLGLAVPLAIAGAVVVEMGLAAAWGRAGGPRFAGTAVALAGVVAMTGALAAAWPSPPAALAASIFAGLFLTRVAFRDGLPWVHAVAIPALALAAVVGYHGLAGHWAAAPDLGTLLRPARFTLDPAAGPVLAGFALVLVAVAEVLVRHGARPHAVVYAAGGAAVGLVGLFVASVNGVERPLTAAAVHAACAAGLLASNARWRLRVVAHGALWLALVGSLWALHAAVPNQLEKWAFAAALESLAFAGLALVLKGTHVGATALLRRAGRDVSIAAALLAPALAVFANPLPDTPWDTATLFVLSAVGLVLARLTGTPVATYAGAAAGFLGFVHLAAFTADWEPARRAYLVGALAHATLAAAGAVCLRRLERVFAHPLRVAAMLSSAAAGIVLFAPADGHVLEWAACAAWLGTVWLVIAVAWRDARSFSVFQGALSLAAVLGGVAWIDARAWRPESPVGYYEPAALHVYSVALGLLALVWAVARRQLRNNSVARELWVGLPWSAERVVLAGLVVGHLILVALAILPEVSAELAPAGTRVYRTLPAELAQAFGAGAWAVVGVLAVAVLASWRLTGTRRDTDAHLGGLALLFATVPVVWAGTHAADLASATALRWGLGAAFAVGTALVAARWMLAAVFLKLGFPVRPSASARPATLVLLAIAAGVVVFLSFQVAELGLSGRAPSGPASWSAFAAMGVVPSNLVPLALVVIGLAWSAARERSTGYAFAGGVVFVATLAGGYALGVVTGGGTLDAVEKTRAWLLACGGAAAWALAWLAAERRVSGGMLLALQSRLGLAGLVIVVVAPLLMIVARPDQQLPAFAAPVGEYGWFALALATAAALWRARRTEPGLLFHSGALSAVLAGVLVACAVRPWYAERGWVSFHVLGAAWAAVALGLAVAARKRGESSFWLDGLCTGLAVLALRGGWDDPFRPWFPAALALVAGGVMVTAALLNRSAARVVASGVLVNFAAVLLWMALAPNTTSGFLLANAAGLAVAALVWTLIARGRTDANWHAAADVARGLSLVLLCLGLAPAFAGERTDPRVLLQVATSVIAAGMLVALREPLSLVARGGLYAAALVWGAVAVLPASPGVVAWNYLGAPFFLAGHTALVSLVALSVARRPERFPVPDRGDTWGWLVGAQAAVAALAVLLGVRLAVTEPDLVSRLVTGPAPVLLLVGAAVLLLGAVPAWANALRYAVVGLSILVPATAAWAVPDPGDRHAWLHRNAWLFAALAAGGVLLSELARRLGEAWRPAARRVGGVAVGLAVVALGVNLAQQVPVFDPVTRHTPLAAAAVLAMLAGVAALVVLAVRYALRRDLDPLDLPDRWRQFYVYLAEVLVVLLFTHVRFNVPELFLAGAVRYWTFAVMGLAFAGVGLAELFERRKLDVLATPLRRTGVLLPLLPLLAFWAKPPAALNEFAAGQAPGLSPMLGYLQNLPQHFDMYAWLWFLAGGVYGLVALSRNSFGWALLAALATNAALWSLLTHTGVPFVAHPQAWVIPLALIVLVSEHVNREKLRPDLSNGLRYLGVGMIYVASAADMFIAGVGQSVWLPVVLAVLCVIGILAGMLMRVRAFVFLGVGFLLLDLFAMIWHAAVDLNQTWVWYVSGILLGVAILALFAWFEKRKAREKAEADEAHGPR